MPVQVTARNFDITEGIRENVVAETKDRMIPLAQQNFSSKWSLSLEAGEHIAHVAWADGHLRGDVTVKTHDMYSSIHQCAKKAAEQIKKAHAKRSEKRHVSALDSQLTPEDNEELD